MWRQLKTVLQSVRVARGDFRVSTKLARSSLYALVALSTMFLTSLAVHAAPTVLHGRIGQAAVVMELEVSAENRVDGRYFYRRFLEDIALTGTREADGSLRLEERPASDKPNKLILRPQGSGWRGEWHGSRDEKPLIIELARLTKAELPAPGDPALTPWIAKSPYDYVRFTSMHLRPGRYQVFQGYGLQWWIEPQSNIQFFRVATGFPQETLDQINQRLSERRWLEVERSLACKFGGLLGHGSSFAQTVTLRFINSQVLSVSVFSDYYCSGAPVF